MSSDFSIQPSTINGSIITLYIEIEPNRNIPLNVPVSDEILNKQNYEPQAIEIPAFWLYRNKVVHLDEKSIFFLIKNSVATSEMMLRLKHFVLQTERELNKIKREVEAFENMERLTIEKNREPISESIRLFVWQRDRGKCVQCGSKEKLEYDHIIPFSKGGSNTERNIQLLCETCNRKKSDSI